MSGLQHAGRLSKAACTRLKAKNAMPSRCDNTNSNLAMANPFLHVSVVSKTNIKLKQTEKRRKRVLNL
jgi:hypothetical protein